MDQPDNPSSSQTQDSTPSTEIVVVSGGCCRVDGDVESVEERVLDAARGSLLELVWFTETESGRRIALNPEHVVWLRAAS
jgi:uncharacterized protein YlzI (FlbEa/FlbD family)